MGKARVRLRVMLGAEIAMGPGKAQLLAGIRDTGSIAAAGRTMNMSYKRAWQLVDTMNRCYTAPLVEASKGGKHGGGAVLTPLGEEILRRYDSMEHHMAEAIAEDLAFLERWMREGEGEGEGA